MDTTTIYFSGEQLLAVPKGGGQVQILHSQPTDAVTVGGDFVYFSDFDPGENIRVRRWSAQIGSELVAELKDAGRSEHLVHQDGYLYTMSLATAGARASRVRISDGTEVFIADNIQVSRGFVVAGSFLYFTENETQSVQRVSLDDGTRATLATFAGYPWAIDSDGSLIYLTVQYLNPDTGIYTSALIRMTVDGTDPCVVGSAANFASVAMYGDRVHWTGDCSLQGAR